MALIQANMVLEKVYILLVKSGKVYSFCKESMNGINVNFNMLQDFCT